MTVDSQYGADKIIGFIVHQLKVLYVSPRKTALLYLIFITIAEICTSYGLPALGLVIHGLILIALLIHSAINWEQPEHRLLLTLTLAPLIRLLSLSLPLSQFPLISWYLIISLPLFTSAYIIVRSLRLSWKGIGFTLNKFPLQLLLGMTGFGFGLVEYSILKSQPLISSLSLQELLLPSIVLVISTGFMEELVFRGIMQQAGKPVLGRWNPFFVNAIFMVLHIGYQSVLDLTFVFIVGFFWSWVKTKTGSLLGITISHGITNIMLFLVLPFIVMVNTPLSPSEIANPNTGNVTNVVISSTTGSNPFQPGVPLMVVLLYLLFVAGAFTRPSNKFWASLRRNRPRLEQKPIELEYRAPSGSKLRNQQTITRTDAR